MSGHAPLWEQAMEDINLSATTSRVMWFMQKRLAFHEYREVYTDSLAREMGIEPQTVGRCLRALVDAGYLLTRGKRPRAYMLVWSHSKAA